MSINRWLNWTPDDSIFQYSSESEPTKPSKPGSVGFEGAVPGELQEIGECSGDAEAEHLALRKRREAGGVYVAIWEDGAMRVVHNDQETNHGAKDGTAADSWKKILIDVTLSEQEKRMLHAFKEWCGG